MARRRRLAALLRHTRQPEPTAQSSAASPTIIEEVKPVPSLLSRCSGPEDLTASAHLKTLEADDVAFFKANGFLIKKGLLDAAKVEHARSAVWDAIEGKMPHVPDCPEQHQHSASPGVRRDDPTSWVGASVNADGNHGGGLRSLGHLPWMLELVPNDPNVRAIATALLGPLRPSLRTRGVYVIFPREPDNCPPLSGAALGPHNDGVAQQLNVMCYLDPVGPRCGGFTLWPGSHKLMYYGMRSEFNHGTTEDYAKLRNAAVEDTIPVEICGEPGDVVWWHGRTLHSAGIHRGPTVRLAIPGDFQQANRPTLPAVRPAWPVEPDEIVNRLEWFKDTLPFADDLPPQPDMWASWAV